MDIIIAIDKNNKKQKLKIPFSSNDNLLIYSETVADSIEFLDADFSFNSIFIRTPLNYFDETEKVFCKENNIFLSIIVDKSTNANMLMEEIERLKAYGCKCELLVSNIILSNKGLLNVILECVTRYDIELRISKHNGKLFSFMAEISALQNELIKRDCEIILKPLASAFKTADASTTCKFININERILLDFSQVLAGCAISQDKEAEISKTSLEATLLPSTRWNDREAYTYLRELELKKVSTRLVSQKTSKNNDSNDDFYDLILIYTDRFRNRISAPYPPIGLYYLNAVVKQKGYTCKVIECTECDFQSMFYKQIKDHCKVVGFYCACNNEYLVSNMIKYIKRCSSDLNIIIGGPQTVALDAAFIENTGVDIISVGEGEDTTVELLDYFIKQIGDLSSIKNIKYIKDDKYYENPLREVILDLDSLPFAKIKYADIAQHNTVNRIFILTGRGCPNRCTFCYEGANSRKVRYRSMENVFEEINYLLNEFPLAGLLHVLDDTFTCNEKRVLDFCERMREIRKKRNIEWVCEAHINTIYNKPYLLKTMIDSGLRGFQIGLESGSDDILKAYRKNTSVKMIKDFIETCVSVDTSIFIEGNIIIGGPFESFDTIQKSLDLCKFLISKARGMVELQALSFVPLPNTDITLNPEKYGLTLLWDRVETSTLSMLDIVTETKYLSREQLHEAKENFNLELKNHYTNEVINFTPEQVMRFWDFQNRQFLSASQWGSALNCFEHFRNFALSKSYEDVMHVEKDQNVIPVRTFESVEYINEILQKYSYNLLDIEKMILKYCNGKSNIGEIASTLSMNISDVFIYTDKLENKCLLKYSAV